MWPRFKYLADIGEEVGKNVFHSGHKCTRPGFIPNGRWLCEEQEIPIPETADLNGDLETYPGMLNRKKFPF